MNKRLVLLLTAIFLAGAAGIDIPAQAEVAGPFGYDLQKDIHRSKNKAKQDKAKQQQKEAEQSVSAETANVAVTDEDIFNSSVNFNKEYYPNASMKSVEAKYKKGNYTGCLQELYTIVKKQPENAIAYYYVAMAYTKVGAVEQAKAAYQKVINLNSNPFLVDYARKGKDCLIGGPACVTAKVDVDLPDDMNELDKFIAAPYGNGMSKEMNEQYKQQQLNAIQNKINNGNTLTPEDIQKMRELQNNKSEALSEDKLAMADGKAMPSNEEVLGALDVLKRAGLNISAQESQNNAVQPVASQPSYMPDPQIQQMSMMLNGNNNGYNNDPMMTMLPYMMEGEGKKVDPQVIQAMMMNSMMNSLNGMNNTNNNN